MEQPTPEERKEFLQYAKEQTTSDKDIIMCDRMLEWEGQGQSGGFMENSLRFLRLDGENRGDRKFVEPASDSEAEESE